MQEVPHHDNDLDWIDSPLVGLLKLAWPIIISMLSLSLMTLVDTFFVSRLGSWALAGVGLGGILSFILVCFPIGLLGAVKILISQSIGAGLRDNVQVYLGAGLLLAVIMAGMTCVAALVLSGLAPSVAATEETGTAAATYLRIGAFGTLPILLRITLEQGRIAIGDSQSPMRVNLFANCCNVALNYLFIIVLEMGVAGAAYGTLGANILGCIGMFWIQSRDGIDVRRTHRHDIAAIWRLGLPSGLQFSLELGAFAVMVVMLTNLSELDGAANQVAIQVIHFGFLPCVALGEAASVMAGQAVGAGRRELVHKVALLTLIPTVLYTMATAAVFGVFGQTIIAGFTNDTDLLALGTKLLLIAALFQIPDGINIIARTILRGTGDVRFCMWMGISLSWIMTPPMTWWLGYQMGLGAVGGWLGLTAEVALGATIFWTRLRGTRWHRAADQSVKDLTTH